MPMTRPPLQPATQGAFSPFSPGVFDLEMDAAGRWSVGARPGFDRSFSTNHMRAALEDAAGGRGTPLQQTLRCFKPAGPFQAQVRGAVLAVDARHSGCLPACAMTS